jgi:hypothetical protein
MSKSTQFAIGDRVQLTSKFLRNTGQYTGREPSSVWTITGFSAENPNWAVTDEPGDTSYYTADELAAEPSLAFRRIAVGNLQKARR